MKEFRYSILILVTFTLLMACGNFSANREGETPSSENGLIAISQTQFEANDMVLGSLEQREFPTLVRASGSIDVPPENRSMVSAIKGGYIKNLPLLVGDRIRKGQLLLTVENPEFVDLQQAYMEVTGQLGYLKAEYERQKTMYDEKITSQKSFTKAESEYKSALAIYNGLRQQLVMLNIAPKNVETGNISPIAAIYAPISGTVTKINVAKGSYVAPDTPILEIVDNTHIHLELSVFEKNIMKVKKGQRIDFKIPEASTNTFEGEVHLVGTNIGEGRTIQVHGHLKDKEQHDFLTGMFVEANIHVDSKTGMTLPAEALVNVGERVFVLVLRKKSDGNYFFEQLQVSAKTDHLGYSYLENTDGLKTSDQFLIRGAFGLIGE